LEDGLFGEPPPEQRRELAELQADCVRLASQVQDFCDFLRGSHEVSTQESANLEATLAHEVETLRNAGVARALHLELDLPPSTANTSTTLRVCGASDLQLGRMIRRLFHQALRFAPPRTTIRVALVREAKWWRLEVEDEGPCPSDAENLRHDWDRWQRPDDLHGLVPELALVEAWVRNLGGCFALRRTDMGGLCVATLLPAEERIAG
jgi:K+-sensing histidine kinase KdpD